MGIDSAPPRRRLARLWVPFARKRPLTCQEMVELITDYWEDVLDPPTRARFEHHLASCDGCHTYLQELRATIGTVGALTDEQLDPIFRDRLMAAFTETTGSW